MSVAWVAAGAVVVGAAVSADSSRSAANTQADSARAGTAAQTAAADKSNQTQLQLQQNALGFEQQQTAPYTQAGQTALDAYMQQLGLTPPSRSSSSVPNAPSATTPQGALGMWMGPGAPPPGSQNSSSALTRDQLIKQLTPQFTKVSSPSGIYQGATGGTGFGVTPAAASTTTIDQAGLNAAVDAALKKQASTSMAPATPATVAGPVNNGQNNPFDVSKIPGYAFMKSEALDALNNSSSATTGALSGNAQKALVDRISGLASTEYGSYLDRISGLVSLGENAGVNAGNTGVGIIQGAGNNISANQMALGGQIGSNLIGAGNTTAAGQVASGNAWGSAANTIFSNQQTQKSLGSLFSNDNSVSDSTANSWNTDEMARITAEAG